MLKKWIDKKLKEYKTVFVMVCPGDDIYNIEWMLLEKCNCHYWNSGDYHQDSEYRIGDTKDFNVFFSITHNRNKNIYIMTEVWFKSIEPNDADNTITSQMILREMKLIKLKKKCSKLEK